ncbi:MAG: O-antigen ligase family protein [Tenuifilum sp.]|uniref:O-antigen ligase family protein n=1 Tax=Tenuifilum sp. TaxID=2760880 RepID=UPI0030A7DE00
MFGEHFHQKVYLAALVVILCSLPSSIIGLSIGTITLVVNFLLSGNWAIKLQRLKSQPMVLVFMAMYLPILLSGLLSSNHRLGLEIVRLWLPVLLIPPIIAASQELTSKEFRLLLCLFILSTFIVTILGTYNYLTGDTADIRKISPFISHIRLALMVNLALAIMVYFIALQPPTKNLAVLLHLFVLIWFLFFLFLLASFTGILMLVLLIVLIVIKYLFGLGSVARFVTITGLSTLIFLMLSYLLHKYDSMNTIRLSPENSPKTTTVNGNPYQHDLLSKETENGYLVNINICEDELRNEWPKRSNLSYDGTDKKGQPLRSTLIRYLTSAGLTKDSVGLSHLDSADIALVELGYTNTIFKKRVTGFDSRLYEFFYELNKFRQSGTLTGGSVLRRLIYARAAWHVIKGSPILGVGYGDLPTAMNQFYDIYRVDLPQSYRFMPHNQYLTIWASAGIIGLAVFLLSLSLPFLFSSNLKAMPVLYFWVMVLISMLFEDTMLTHTGISFVAVFSALFLFGHSFPIVKKEDYAAR